MAEAGDAPAVAPAPAPKHRIEPEVLIQYYKNLFPAKEFGRWLSYGSKDTFRKREFSFTKNIRGADGEESELYTRYRSFENSDELLKEMLRWKPEKIDIGAVYSHPPKFRDRAQVFTPVQRELVFDIDLSDYDNVRNCCQAKKVCVECWPYMVVGLRVLDSMLRRDFGFKHLLWIFSGRRGIHCWVCDEQARFLSDEDRAAVAKYLETYEGGASDDDNKLSIEENLKRPTEKGGQWLHPSLKEEQGRIEEGFKKIFLRKGGPNSLEVPKIRDRAIAFFQKRIPSTSGSVQRDVTDAIRQCNPDPEAAWRKVEKALVTTARGAPSWGWVGIALQFAFVYPRLDVNVSTKRNHLLKSPFVAHPGTGKLCVPLLMDEIDTFNPDEDPPKIMELMDQWALAKTERVPRIQIFEDFLAALEADEGRRGLVQLP